MRTFHINSLLIFRLIDPLDSPTLRKIIFIVSSASFPNTYLPSPLFQFCALSHGGLRLIRSIKFIFFSIFSLLITNILAPPSTPSIHSFNFSFNSVPSHSFPLLVKSIIMCPSPLWPPYNLSRPHISYFYNVYV